MISPPVAGRRALRRIHRRLGDHPAALPLILRATPLGTERAITDRTELVIEGYPRSGNTFAVFAFQHAQPREVVVASHVHVPAQVVRAVQREVPTLVVVREPVATVASLVIAAPHVTLQRAFREYTHYHEILLPHRQGFVLADFDQVTTDLGSVITEVNRRFGTEFAPFVHTVEVEAEVLRAIDAHHLAVHGGAEDLAPRPSGARTTRSETIVRAADGAALAKDRASARRVYEAIRSV